MISSTIVLAGFLLAHRLRLSDSGVTWLTWWLADAAAALLIVPAVVLWVTTPAQFFQLETTGTDRSMCSR